MKQYFRSLMFKIWYWYISKVDKNGDVLFMNYGYEDPNEIVQLHANDEKNRYSIQLYHRLAAAVELKGKDILEVGCGRGGGLDYVARTFSPKTALGIDLEQKAADFGNKQYKVEGLRFQQGNAMSLPIDNQKFDVVLNVESSHRYPDMKLFLNEVQRVLKPGGYFLFTDFRYNYEMNELNETFAQTGLTLLENKKINANVVASLEADNDRRKELVFRLTPKMLHNTALNFAGTVGSETYNQIKDEDYIYFVQIYQKK